MIRRSLKVSFWQEEIQAQKEEEDYVTSPVFTNKKSQIQKLAGNQPGWHVRENPGWYDSTNSLNNYLIGKLLDSKDIFESLQN